MIEQLTNNNFLDSRNQLGIDIGGTFVKFGILNEKKELIYKDSIPTNTSSESALIMEIIKKCRQIITANPIARIGIGVPGAIENGNVTASNLPLDNTPLARLLQEQICLPVIVQNDANCAALCEKLLGVGKQAKNMIMITLGTGVGGGIIIDGNVYEGKGSAGEIGHMIVEKGGRKCSCGQHGCLEAYASASALVESATEAALKAPDSLLYKLYLSHHNSLNGKLFFEALDANCPTAKTVFAKYIEYLVAGVDSIYNIFHPDLIVLAGGITQQGTLLLDALKKQLETPAEVAIAEQKSDAGIIGAALLTYL